MLQHRIRRPSLSGIRKTPVRGRTPFSQQPSTRQEVAHKGKTGRGLVPGCAGTSAGCCGGRGGRVPSEGREKTKRWLNWDRKALRIREPNDPRTPTIMTYLTSQRVVAPIRTLLVFPTIALVGPALLGGQTPPASGSPQTLTDLRAVLDTGVVLQDRNGDGVVDDLELQILLSSEPTEGEVAAAANLGARFGYETSATDLGLTGRASSGRVYGSPVVLVGERALTDVGLPGGARGILEGLAPGQGVVSHLPSGATFASGAVAVAGYDATGLLTAAGYLSGRYPGVWAPDGITWREVAEKVEGFAEGHGLEDATVSLDQIVVDGARPGIARALVVIAVPDGQAFDAAVDAFLGKDTLPVAGEEPDTAVAQEPDTAVAPVEGDSTEVAEPDEITTLSDLEFRALHRLDVRIVGPDRDRTITLRPEEPWEIRAAGSFSRGADASFTLPNIYQVGGLFRDTNRDLVADETAAFISLSGNEAPSAVLDLATRVGLETAGIRLPLVQLSAQENDPTTSGFPVFLGTDHYQIRRLQEEGKLPETEVGIGEGFVQFVEGAFGERNALAIGGGNEAGLLAATEWLAYRAPYLWTHGKGEYRLADAETEVRRFLQARQASGQIALALTKLGSWMDRLADDPPSRVEVELAAQEVPEAVNDLAALVVRDRFPGVDVSVQNWSTGFGVGDTVFVQEWEIPWEVDEVRALLEDQVYPNLRPGAPADIEIRVSEPPEIREALEREVRAALVERGVTDATVHILSAYKQGYSWINDVLLPQLRGQQVASIDLTYHTLEESEEVRWQTIAAENRWLQEVYPIDAILARELGISDSVVTFHPTRQRDPIYTFEARDTTGALLLRETFDPRYVVRPFFDHFPEYEQVRVTTGWITASSGEETLLDRRIVTDPERFWDRLQTETYGEMISYIMDIQDGNPAGDNAPFFDEFRVDLRLSEPDYRIGVDEEIISSLEALHEDLYFETNTLFSLLAGRYQTSLSNPGRVLPFVDPSGAGQPGVARLVLTGKERGNPELVVRSWTSDSPEPLLQKYELSPLPVDEPGLVGAVLTDGQEGLRQLLVRVTVPDSVDRYEEFAARSTESGIDRQFLNVELLEGMLRSMRDLH